MSGAEEEVVVRARRGRVEPHVVTVLREDNPRLPLVPKGFFRPVLRCKDHLIICHRMPLLWHKGHAVPGRLNVTA